MNHVIEKRLKAANSVKDHIKDLKENNEYKSNKSGKTYLLEGCDAIDIKNENIRNSMVDMVESALMNYYINSSWGWNRKDKYNELFSNESHFIIIKQQQHTTTTITTTTTSSSNDNSSDDQSVFLNGENNNNNNNNNNNSSDSSSSSIVGFVMFRFCYDDDDEPEFPCLYMFELNISPTTRGDGLGRYLVELLFKIQAKWRLWKTMLTCFIDNTDAMKFYERLGFGVDVYSPSRCKGFEEGEGEEGGTEVRYEILSNRPDVTE